MVNFDDAELEQLNAFIVGDNIQKYKDWLAGIKQKKGDSKAYLRNSLSNINVPIKIKADPPKEEAEYPLKFANDQLLNKWLDKTLKNIESGSKPLAILESITGLALLEGKLMSLVMTVLDGVLTDDDLKNMTVYGIKSFATTRFAKLFFDDFGTMMPVMERIGSPTEVLKIVDKLRQAMGNPEEEAPVKKKEPTPEEMQKMLNEWFNGSTKQMLTDYLVNTFQFTAPQASSTGAAQASAQNILSSIQQSAQLAQKSVTTGLDSAASSVTKAAESVVNVAEPTNSPVAQPTNSPVAQPIKSPVPVKASNFEGKKNIAIAPGTGKPLPEVKRSKTKQQDPALAQLKEVDEKDPATISGGTRRHAAPSQAVTRKRWFEVTLRDVLSGTQ